MNHESHKSSPVAKSYIWHKGECYFVSTIERLGDAIEGTTPYNETIVWRYDWEARERGTLIHHSEDIRFSISGHVQICEDLHVFGLASLKNEDDDS